MSQERRSRLIIKKTFQKQFLKLIVSSMVILLVVALAAIYIALRIQITRAGFAAYTEIKLIEVISWLNWFLPLAAVILSAVAVYVGVRLSLKVAGPLFALERQLTMIKEGEIESVQLRSDDDELTPLAKLINEVLAGRSAK